MWKTKLLQVKDAAVAMRFLLENELHIISTITPKENNFFYLRFEDSNGIQYDAIMSATDTLNVIIEKIFNIP